MNHSIFNTYASESQLKKYDDKSVTIVGIRDMNVCGVAFQVLTVWTAANGLARIVKFASGATIYCDRFPELTPSLIEFKQKEWAYWSGVAFLSTAPAIKLTNFEIG